MQFKILELSYCKYSQWLQLAFTLFAVISWLALLWSHWGDVVPQLTSNNSLALLTRPLFIPHPWYYHRFSWDETFGSKLPLSYNYSTIKTIFEIPILSSKRDNVNITPIIYPIVMMFSRYKNVFHLCVMRNHIWACENSWGLCNNYARTKFDNPKPR